ncbi:MAG: SGNH/GDSL hydrolase family protein [Flavobacterium sp.]
MGIRSRLRSRSGGGSSGADPNRYMFFATRNSILYGNLRVAPADTNYVSSMMYFSCPEYATNDYRFHFSGFSVGASAPTEDRVAGNDMIIDEVWFTNNAGSTWVQGQFSASNSYTVTSGSEGVWTDPVIFGTHTPADGKIGCYLIVHTSVGQNLLTTYRVQNHNGERVWGANNLATLQTQRNTITDASDSRLYNDFTGDFTGYGQNQQTIYGPDFMVGKGWDGRPVALVCADSIGESRQEFAVSADARGNLGYVRRYLDKTSAQGRIPHFVIGCPGVTSQRELEAASIKRWNVLDSIRAFNGGKDAWTVILNQHGNNDIGASFDINSNTYRSFVARLRARYSGCKIVAMPHLVQTSSADNWTSVGGQTYSGNNIYPTGTRFLLRDAIEGATSPYCDAVINNHVYEDPTDAGKWRTGLFETTLASAVGTDGIVTYPTIPITNTGAIQDDGLVIVSLNQNRTIRYVSGTTLTLVQPSANILPSGEVLKSRSSTDGIHPSPRMCIYMADNIAQTEKLKLRR